MKRKHVSAEFHCWRISVIVHHSADKLDSLVPLGKLACLRTESFIPPKWFVSDKSFPIKDL